MKGLVLALVSLIVLAGVAVSGPGSAEAAFVYACSPVASVSTSGGGGLAVLTIYNPNTTTVNVAAKWLTKAGVNLAGVTIPCAGCTATTYPGQTGATTVPISAGNTRVTSYQFPDQSADLGGLNVAATIRVVSDQPVNVGWAFGGTFQMMCTESQ